MNLGRLPLNNEWKDKELALEVEQGNCAALLFCADGTERALPLIDLSRNNSLSIRETAALALPTIDDPGAIERLRQIADEDASPSVRDAARNADAPALRSAGARGPSMTGASSQVGPTRSVYNRASNEPRHWSAAGRV